MPTSRWSGMFESTSPAPSRWTGMFGIASPEPEESEEEKRRNRWAGMFAPSPDEEAARAAARERISGMQAGGEEQWGRIEESQRRPSFGEAFMGQVDDARNVVKAGVRGIQNFSSMGLGAAEAAGAYLQSTPETFTDPSLGLVNEPMPSMPGGELMASAGQALQQKAAEERAKVEGGAQWAAREEGYIPEDFWEGMAKDPIRTLTVNGLENIGPLAATLAATAVGGPMAGLPVAFGIETGAAWTEAKEAGASDEQALQAAGMTGVANAALEYLPAGRIFNQLAKGAPKNEVLGFVRNAITQAVSEGITESMQEANNLLVSMGTYARDAKLDWEEIKRIGAAGLIGAVMGGGAGIGASAVSAGRAQAPVVEGDRTELNVSEVTIPEEAAVEQPASKYAGMFSPAESAPVAKPVERTGSGLSEQAVDSWIERLGDGKPKLGYQVVDNATAITYRDPKGRVVAAAVLNADNSATDLMFKDERRGALAARGAVAVGRELTRRGVTESSGEISPEALRFRVRMENEGRAEQPLPRALTPQELAERGIPALESAQEATTRADPATATSQEAVTPQKRDLAPERQGLEGRAFTATGTEVPFRWAVVDAVDLIPSHDTGLRPNAAFPGELQPRQRGRAASREQIEGMAQNLNPERLGESSSAAEGAPIVGPDFVVESGNARTIAVTTAYERGAGDKYRQMVQDKADRYGINPKALEGIERPVLVRVRQGEADRARLAQEMNESAVATMSATEKAEVDATRLTPEMLEGLQPSDSGDFNTANSGDFIRGFQQRVVPQAERGQMVDERGHLSQQGKARIRNAVFAAAYGNPEIASRLIESEDSAIKALGQALFREAPRVVKIKQAFASGDRHANLDIVPDVMEAARKLDDLRREGVKVEDYLAQGELLGPELSAEARAVLATVGGPIGRSSKKMADVLRRYQELVDSAGNPKQRTLMAVGSQPTKIDLWSEAVETYEKAGQGDLFLPPQVQDLTAQAGYIGSKAEPRQSPNAFSRPEVEAGFKRGRLGQPDKSIVAKVKESAVWVKEMFSRDFHHLPSGAKFARARESLRRLRTYNPTEEVARKIGKAVSPLNDKQYDLFLRKTLLDDLDVIARNYPEGTQLPFEMTPQDLAADKPKIDSAVESDPYVKRAVAEIREVWREAREEYREAAEKAGMDTDFLDRRGEAYLHHQVIQHALAEGARGGGKVKTPKGRSFQRKLRGSTGDINLNYGEAQGQVLVQLGLDAQMARTIADFDRNYSITDKLKAEAKKKGVHWETLIPEDHLPYQADEGSLFHTGQTITERIARRLLADPVVGVTPADIRKSLVVGGKKKTMVLPKEIVNTLSEMGANDSKSFGGQVARANRAVVRTWKVAMLLMPRRKFKYATRNIVGDTNKTAYGNPAALKRFKQVATELGDYVYAKGEPTADLKTWMAIGGWSSGLFQQEVQSTEAGRRQRLKAATEFAGALEQVKDMKKLPAKYFAWAGKNVSYLEAINRYANFLEYKAQMQADPEGRPKNFGASIPAEIMALEDIDTRAYWLSNQLIGAYDQVSELGQVLRHHFIPFWSFQELNVKSHWGLVRNAVTAPESAMKRAKKMGLISGKMGGAAAFRVAKLAGLMVAFEAFMHAWNYGLFKDEEDDLPMDIRRTPHIILGRDSEGNVLYFNRLSIFAEAREWFGTDEFGYGVMDYLDGRISGGQLLKDVVSAPTNKVLNSIGPVSGGGIKLALELGTGMTTFPEPRPIHDRWDYAYRTIGMEEEFRALTKRPTPSGGFAKTWKNVFIYAAEPGAAAYYDTLSTARRFMAMKGEESSGSFSSARTDALRQFKRAQRYEQPEVAEKYLRLYVAAGGTATGFKQSLSRMDPLRYVPKKFHKELMEWMTPEERAKLEDAKAYYEDVFGERSPGTREAIAAVRRLEREAKKAKKDD